MTGVAANPQKTVLETPALEVVLELLLDIPRQVRALRRQVRQRVITPDNGADSQLPFKVQAMFPNQAKLKNRML